jgi:hypothetical protein
MELFTNLLLDQCDLAINQSLDAVQQTPNEIRSGLLLQPWFRCCHCATSGEAHSSEFPICSRDRQLSCLRQAPQTGSGEELEQTVDQLSAREAAELLDWQLEERFEAGASSASSLWVEQRRLEQCVEHLEAATQELWIGRLPIAQH